jgi:ATP-dependent Clp protease ATP-binding subunit ClpA
MVSHSHSRYSHHARRALTHAGVLVQRYRHPRADTAHLLVGVLLTEGSIGCAVLRELGLSAAHALPHLETLTLPLEKAPEAVTNDAALDLALELAADESAWLGHHYIGTEHLLLGMTRTNLGNASDLLRHLHVSPEQVRRRVRRAVKDGQTEFTLQLVRRNARFSEIARRVLTGAEQLSVSLDHQTVGVGHLLLALLKEPRGETTGLLRESGLNSARLRQDLQAGVPLLLMSIEALLHHAIELSEQHNHHYTGTEHLILALCSHPDVAQLLTQYDATPQHLLHIITQQMQR